ncbi:MAG: DUF711 family protein [Ktedonobacteraceae bacterium]|nr:DUF711 family protein [Ktedonobacteraceae bacterium]
MALPPVRTITLGIAEMHPLSRVVIERAAAILKRGSERYADAGYEVQTTRLSTRPIFDDLADWSWADVLTYAGELQRMLDDVGLSFCSLGTAQAARPGFPLERIDLIADLLALTSALNATVQLATLEDGLRIEAALPAAQVMGRLARETQEGFGNFRFAALACVEPGCPFFPTAYHSGPASLSLGVQGASIINDALWQYARDRAQDNPEQAMPLPLAGITERVRMALIAQATPVVTLGRALAQEHGLRFGGVDLSPAPLGEDSIVTALELCGYGAIGDHGSIAAAAALTSALKTTGLPTCGYCGLMLPVLEDAVLGRRWEEGHVGTHQLLLYSAVCGTGLDTIPLPGSIPPEVIAHLLLDVATLAVRWQKPLSARLFPVPDKQVGDRTTFTSPYLTNTLIR